MFHRFHAVFIFIYAMNMQLCMYQNHVKSQRQWLD